MTQLAQLARPFPKGLVKPAPRGKYGDYIPHATITERLLEVVGPFDFQVRDVIRGAAPKVGEKFAARENAIVGVLATMTVTIDGETISITEVGTEDSPAMHHDGENLKNATSDAIKRCAMRLGIGLHLWSGDDYYLDRALAKRETTEAEA